MFKPYPVHEAKNNTDKYYLSTLLDSIADKINVGIESESKKGYSSATIVYQDYHERDAEVLVDMFYIIRTQYMQAGYRDVDTDWHFGSNGLEYVITVFW